MPDRDPADQPDGTCLLCDHSHTEHDLEPADGRACRHERCGCPYYLEAI